MLTDESAFLWKTLFGLSLKMGAGQEGSRQYPGNVQWPWVRLCGLWGQTSCMWLPEQRVSKATR